MSSDRSFVSSGRYLALAWDLGKRDLEAKYKRSLIGPFWLLLTPLVLLGIYWLVFGQILGIKWQSPLGQEDGIGFLLPFFAGLVIYLTLSDVVNSSSVLFSVKRTYVVKSPFPIWVLWVANLLRSAVHALVMLGLLIFLAFAQQRLTITGIVWLIPVFFSCVLFMCAASLLLAALGPFIGDISEAMRLVLRVLFYATPITYPLTLVPEPWRDWMWLNPLTSMVEIVRAPLVFGAMPPLSPLLGLSLFSIVSLLLAVWIFFRVRGVISDVV